MNNNPIDKLNAAFDNYDKKQTAAKNEAEKNKTEHEVYLDDFKKKCEEVIMPAMEEIGQSIEIRGHKYEIKQREEHVDNDGRTTCANIEFEIHPNGKRPDRINRDYPCLAFMAGTYDNKTWTHVSTMMPGRGGSSGKQKEFILSQITQDVVQEEIVNLVVNCFGK